MSLLQLILSKAEEGFEISFRNRGDKLTEVLVMRSGKHASQVFETHRTRINDDAGVAAYCINVCCELIEHSQYCSSSKSLQHKCHRKYCEKCCKGF